MEISPTTVFRKTERGTEELKTRAHGLTPRLRQLLILVDGRRDVAEIARVLPQPGLDAQMAQLASDGFIASAAKAAAGGGVDAPQAPSERASLPQPRFENTGTNTGTRSSRASAGSTPADTATAKTPAVPGDRPAAAHATVPPAPSAPAEDLRTLRRRVTQALLEIVGPNGDDFAIRIERAASVGDLRAMVPALLSIVEAIGGRRGVDRFLERCGPI